MRILILTGGFPSSDNPSKSIFNYRAVLGLKTIGDVLVVHLRYWRPGRRLVSRGKYREIDILSLALPWIPISSGWLNALNIFVWQRLVRYLVRDVVRSYEVIHSIGLEAAPIGSFLSAKHGIPHFAQAIGSDLLFYLPQKEPYFGIARWVNHTKAVICNSHFLKKEVQGRYPDMAAEVAYRGTDLARYVPVSRPSDKVITLLFLGGFSDRQGTGFGADLKGGETLKAVWEAIDAGGNVVANLWLGGPQSNSDALDTWVKRLKHPKRVRLLGQLMPDEVPATIAEADVVLIPSMSEGLPNVAVEACASGKLVLASRVGGIPEIIKDGETGFLMEPGNVVQWASKIAEIVSDFKDYERLCFQAREFVQTTFDNEKYPARLFTIYRKFT